MDKAKQFLFWALGALSVVFIALGLSVIGFVSDVNVTHNTVSFNGEGKVSAVPDVAVLNLTIFTEAKTSQQAQDENAKKSDSVVDFLKDEGIDKKDIKTVSYNIHPKYGRNSVQTDSYIPPWPGNQEIIGYEVMQTVEVKIRDIKDAGRIMSGAVEAGADRINSFRFEIDDPDELMSQARELAIKDAKQKAKDLEKQTGIRLGKIVNFSEGRRGMPMPVPLYAAEVSASGKGGAGIEAPTLPEGESEVVVNVNLTYQIK